MCYIGQTPIRSSPEIPAFDHVKITLDGNARPSRRAFFVAGSSRASQRTEKRPRFWRGLCSRATSVLLVSSVMNFPDHALRGLRRLGVLVDLGFGELAQRAVRCLLFPQRRVEQLDGVLVTQFARPGLEGAVAGNLVVLDGLRGRKKAGVKGGHALVLVH